MGKAPDRAPRPRHPARDPAGGAAPGDTPHPPRRQNNTGQGSARRAAAPRSARLSPAQPAFCSGHSPAREGHGARSSSAGGGGARGGSTASAPGGRAGGAVGAAFGGRDLRRHRLPPTAPARARPRRRGDSPAGLARAARLSSARARSAPPAATCRSLRPRRRDRGTRRRHARAGAAERATVTPPRRGRGQGRGRARDAVGWLRSGPAALPWRCHGGPARLGSHPR